VQVDFLNDRHAWPLLAGLTSGMALYLCSAAAHCLQSRSELAHYVAFTFDYAGIGLYGLGSVIMHLEYCSEDAFYDTVQPLFVPAGCILAVLICFCCSVSKTRYERPYPFTRKVCPFDCASTFDEVREKWIVKMFTPNWMLS
jgi:predicted membrane channel-forming protein YqfA (hemolysin III family)